MTQWIELVMTHMYPWPIGVLVSASAVALLFGVIGLWSLWRVRRLLKIVPQLEERMGTLSHSMSLLTDTTESCFKAISMQLQFMQSQAGRQAVRNRAQAAEPASVEPSTKSRQRRVVGAARRGDAVAAIAAREQLSESEVALRLHINREPLSETGRHGSMHA